MAGWETRKPTGVLVLPDGKSIFGVGIGAVGSAAGEVCFNTAITGYQKFLLTLLFRTDCDFLSLILGMSVLIATTLEITNKDNEDAALGLIIREDITLPANYRSVSHLNDWLNARNLIGLSGVDTRSLTSHIRENGMFNAVIAHATDGNFDMAALQAQAKEFSGLEGLDLAINVSTQTSYENNQGRWRWGEGFVTNDTSKHVVALDYGLKKNILRCLSSAGCQVTVPEIAPPKMY